MVRTYAVESRACQVTDVILPPATFEGDLLLLLSAAREDLEFRLPGDAAGRWSCCLDTAAPRASAGPPMEVSLVRLQDRSLVVLERIE